MLTKIHVKNYKSLKDSNILKIKPLTFLVGPNSSGKSSILQILRLLKQTIDSKDMENPLDTNGGWIQTGAYPDFIFQKDSNNVLYISADFILRKDSINKKNRELQCTALFDYDNKTKKINLKKYETSLDDKSFIIQRKRSGSKQHYELKIKSKNEKDQITFKNVKPLKFYDFAFIFKSKPKKKDFQNIIINTIDLKEIAYEFEQQIGKIDYIGPLREDPHRYYSTSGKTLQNVGIKGELSVDVFWSLKASGKKHNSEKIKKIEYWLKEFNFATSANLVPLGNSNLYNLFFSDPFLNKEVNIADVGFGSSQTLPIIIQSLISPSGSTLLIEQPEIHLHPKAQAILGDLFISSISKLDKSLIVETHSEHMLSRIRRRIAEGKISKDNVAIYYFTQTSDGTEINEVTLDEDGQYVKYPDGFFEEEYNESFEHVKAIQKKNKKSKND